MPFLTELTNALHLERVIVHQLLHQVIRLILSVHATNAMNAFHVDRGKSDATVFATGSTVLIDGQPDLSRSFFLVMADDFHLQETTREQVAAIRFRS